MFLEMKPNIDNTGRAARGGIAVIFLLGGAYLVTQAPVLGTIFILVGLAPVLLLPLFYRFKPLDNTGLRDRLTALAASANTTIRGVYEWTLSDRTKKDRKSVV